MKNINKVLRVVMRGSLYILFLCLVMFFALAENITYLPGDYSYNGDLVLVNPPDLTTNETNEFVIVYMNSTAASTKLMWRYYNQTRLVSGPNVLNSTARNAATNEGMAVSATALTPTTVAVAWTKDTGTYEELWVSVLDITTSQITGEYQVSNTAPNTYAFVSIKSLDEKTLGIAFTNSSNNLYFATGNATTLVTSPALIAVGNSTQSRAISLELYNSTLFSLTFGNFETTTSHKINTTTINSAGTVESNCYLGIDVDATSNEKLTISTAKINSSSLALSYNNGTKVNYLIFDKSCGINYPATTALTLGAMSSFELHGITYYNSSALPLAYYDAGTPEGKGVKFKVIDIPSGTDITAATEVSDVYTQIILRSKDLVRGYNIKGSKLLIMDTQSVFIYNISGGEWFYTAPSFAQSPSSFITYHQNLSVQLNATDPDGDVLTWAINSTVLTINQSGYINDTTSVSDGGNYSIMVNVTDGVNTINLTFDYSIINRAPAVVAVISPSPAYDNNNLTCEAGVTDEDNDNLTITYAWYYDGTLSSITNNTVDESSTSIFQEWNCSVTATDGNLTTTAISTAVQIAQYGGSGGGGGGGGGGNTIIVGGIVQNITFCGDGECNAYNKTGKYFTESPGNCPADCKIAFDNLVTCMFTDPKTCLYTDAWFVNVLLVVIVVGAAYLMLTQQQRPKTY